MNISMLDFNPA